MRFEGSLNIDLNEITTTLVPFPRLRFLQARCVYVCGTWFIHVLSAGEASQRHCNAFIRSMSPLYGTRDLGARGSGRSIDAMFTEAFSRGHQLLRGDPRASLHLACGLMLRGDVVASDVTRNAERLRRELRIVPWNEYGEILLCTFSCFTALHKVRYSRRL